MNQPPDIAAILAEEPKLLALARAVSQDDASDVVQDALLAGWRRGLRGGGIRRWLQRAVRSRSVDVARERARRSTRERQVARNEALPSTAELVEREQLRRRVADAVIQLESPYRETVWQRFFEDRSVAEIATAAGISPETVRTRLRRALAQLRGRLDREHGGSAWLGLLPAAAPVREVTLMASAASNKAAATAAMALLLASLGWVVTRPRAGEIPEVPQPAVDEGMVARNFDEPAVTPASADGPAQRVAVPGLRPWRVRYHDLRPGSDLPYWAWSEPPRWTEREGVAAAMRFDRWLDRRVVWVGSASDAIAGQLEEATVLRAPDGRTRADGTFTVPPDAVALTVRQSEHVLVTFDLDAGRRSLQLRHLAPLKLIGSGVRSNERFRVDCRPGVRRPRSDRQPAPAVNVMLPGRVVTVLAFGLELVGPGPHVIELPRDVEHHVRAHGVAIGFGDPDRVLRVPNCERFDARLRSGSIEIEVVGASGRSIAAVSGRIEAGGRWARLERGTGTVGVLAPASVRSVRVWTEHGERFERDVVVETGRATRVRFECGTGRRVLAIEVPEDCQPRAVLVERPGRMVRAEDPLMDDHVGPLWLQGSDAVTVDALPSDWYRVLVVMRSGRVLAVRSPAEGDVTGEFLPDMELTEIDLRVAARGHERVGMNATFCLRFPRIHGATTWISTDAYDGRVDEAPTWRKCVPIECESWLRASVGDVDLRLPPQRH